MKQRALLMTTSLFAITLTACKQNIFLPIQANNRHGIEELTLTNIGEYGIERAARPTVPAHLHTGIDVARPSDNYTDEPIFPIARGKVISKRTDGPYAQLIVAHHIDNQYFWTCYEHIAGIRVNAGEVVLPTEAMARFMDREELDQFGWQFDHFHLEVLKNEPLPIAPNAKLPNRRYQSYTLTCYQPNDLAMHFYNPVEFLQNAWE